MDSANIQRGLNPPLNEVSFKCNYSGARSQKSGVKSQTERVCL
ncbi:MAG: hypothetical protein AB1815_12750 [Bacillota bacterium]